MADPSDLLKGGELVLTTGIGAGARERDQARWIASVIEQGAAAVAVELGSTWREHVPEPVVRACADADVPLVAFRRAVRFIEITEAVHSAVLNSQFELLRRGEEIHRRFTELILHGRGVPEILAELAAAVGNPVVLEDAGHELVYYVCGPSGDDVALAAWTDLHRAEARGEAPEGALQVDVRLMDSSWGRLLALAVDQPLDDFDRVATERAALAVAIDLLGQQHEEHLRARSRGAFLSDLADGRVDEADARRRAEALGLSHATGRAELLPLAASWRGAACPARGGAVLDAAVGRAASRTVVDRLRRAARPARRRPARAALARRAQLRRGAGRARRRPVPRRSRAPRRRAVDVAALAIGGPAETWAAAGQGLRRVRRSAGAATALRAAPLVRRPAPGRDRPAARPARRARARRVRRRAARPAAGRRLRPPPRAAGDARGLPCGRRPQGQAARALHLERQSLYLRLRRIEELLGVSLDDEDVVLGLHLAVRALAFRRRRTAA